MAKYRLLSTEELKTFEKEFIDYLVVNGITAEDWVQLKNNDLDKAEEILTLFSDVIFEGVLRKIDFLEVRKKTYIQVIQCLSDRMIMIAINAKNDAVDLSTKKWEDVMSSSDYELHKGEKKYLDSRESEIFQMTEKGYEISDGKLFKNLAVAIAQ